MAASKRRWRRSIVLAGLVFAATHLAAGCHRPDPEAARNGVRTALEAWRRAAAEHDGAAVVSVFSRKSLERAASWRAKALHAPEQEVRALPVVDEMFVLLLRLHADVAKLQAMSPGQVLGYFVEMHALGGEYDGLSQFDAIEIVGDAASVRHVKLGHAIGSPVRLLCEDGAWKLDLLSMIDQMSIDLSDLARNTESPHDLRTLAETLVEVFSKKKLEPRNFEPMVQGNT